MNPFRPHWYDDFKDRRYAALFLATLVAFLGLLILAAIIFAVATSYGLQKYFPYVLPGIGLPRQPGLGELFAGCGRTAGDSCDILPYRVTNCA